MSPVIDRSKSNLKVKIRSKKKIAQNTEAKQRRQKEKEEVIKKINEIVDVFVNDLKDSNIELSIKDIIIIG